MDKFYFARPNVAPINFKDTRLLLPIHSIGSVAQLTADVLIFNYGLQRVGTITSRNHIPVVGGIDQVKDSSNDDNHKSASVGVETAIQVYYSAEHNLTLVHQRSPPLKIKKDEFINNLCTWINECAFKEIIVITGVDSASRRDHDLEDPTNMVRVWSKEPKLASQFKLPFYGEKSPLEATQPPLIPHGGISAQLVKALLTKVNNGEQKTCTLLMFSDEADNREQAKTLATTICAGLGLNILKEYSKIPQSWTALDMNDSGVTRAAIYG